MRVVKKIFRLYILRTESSNDYAIRFICKRIYVHTGARAIKTTERDKLTQDITDENKEMWNMVRPLHVVITSAVWSFAVI